MVEDIERFVKVNFVSSERDRLEDKYETLFRKLILEADY
jgi:hypothetical protein